MRMNARKALMKALGDASLRDFRTNDEMEKAHELYKIMAANEAEADKPRPRKRKSTPATGDGPSED